MSPISLVKFMILVTLLLAFNLVLAIGAEDKRIVNGVSVDLTPVHSWLKHHEGERPLKHWKEIKIVKIIGGKEGAVGARALASIEDKGQTEISILHLPSATLAYFKEQEEIDARTAQIQSAEHDLQKAKDAVSQANSKSARNNHRHSYVKAAPQAELKNAQEQLAKMQKHHKEDQAHAKVLAMFTGRSVAETGGVKLEVWDCGISQH